MPTTPRCCAGIEKWLGVITAIRDDDRLTLTVDVTGGLDTRTSLAFALSSGVDAATWARFLTMSRAESQAGNDKDVEIAEIRAERFGFTVVRDSQPDPSYRAGRDIYRAWALSNLGFYAPIVPPLHHPDPSHFRLGGLGGEFLRPRDTDPETIATRCLAAFGPRFSRTAAVIKARLYAMLKEIEAAQPSASLTGAEFFRHLTGRTHASIVSRLSPRLTPLANASLYRASCLLRQSDRRNLQIYHDIIHNLCPALLEVPFDDPAKHPAPEAAQNATTLTDLKPHEIRAYIGPKPVASQPDSPLQHFRTDLIDRINELSVPDAAWNLSTSQFQKMLKFRRMKGADHIHFGPDAKTRPLHAAALLKELRALTS